jgi:hypothetical protein
MARQWIIDCVVSFRHHKTMTMNVTQTRAPSGDQTNHQDAPVASIEPHDGDLVDWSRGAMKAVKAPSNAALARGSTFCETQCKHSTALRLRVASMLRGCLCPVNGRQWMMPRNESSTSIQRQLNQFCNFLASFLGVIQLSCTVHENAREIVQLLAGVDALLNRCHGEE